MVKHVQFVKSARGGNRPAGKANYTVAAAKPHTYGYVAHGTRHQCVRALL